MTTWVRHILPKRPCQSALAMRSKSKGANFFWIRQRCQRPTTLHFQNSLNRLIPPKLVGGHGEWANDESCSKCHYSRSECLEHVGGSVRDLRHQSQSHLSRVRCRIHNPSQVQSTLAQTEFRAQRPSLRKFRRDQLQQ